MTELEKQIRALVADWKVRVNSLSPGAVAERRAIDECRTELEALLSSPAVTEPQITVSVTDAEEALTWAESAGQRFEVSEIPGMEPDLIERTLKLAERDMEKARALLKLTPAPKPEPEGQ